MANRVFIQRSRLGRTVFVLHDEEIEMTVGTPNGLRTAKFPLRTVSPDYTVRGLHFTKGVGASFALSIACIAVAIFLSRSGAPFTLFTMYVAVFAGVMAINGVRLIPRFDFFTFTDHWKRPLFSIARESGQLEECDTFVSDLLGRIERAGAMPDSALLEGRSDLGDVVDAEPEWKWKVSVVAGVATLAVMIAGGYDRDVASVAIFFLMGGPMCAAVSSWMSFAEKERHSRWSLLGVALALGATALALT